MGIDGVVSLLRKAGVLRAGGATYHGKNVGGEFATLDQLGGAPPPTIIQPSGVPPAPPPTVIQPSGVPPAPPPTVIQPSGVPPAPPPTVIQPSGVPPAPPPTVGPSPGVAPASPRAAAPAGARSPAAIFFSLLSWLVGVPAVVMGLAMTLTSVMAGLAWMIGGLVLIPPTNRLLTRVLRVRITGWRKAAALAFCTVTFFVAASFLPDEPVLSADQRYQLTVLLEDDLGMRDVRVGQAGTSVVVRFRQPTMPAEELFAALATVSDILEPQLPEGIEAIRYVFTVSAVDAGYVDVPREALLGWRDRSLTNADFVKSLKRVPLI